MIVRNASARVGRISTRGPYIVAEPQADWLNNFIVTRVTGFVGGSFGHEVRPEPIPLFRPVVLDDGRPAVQMWKGMRNLVRGAMKESGLLVEEVAPVLPPMKSSVSLVAAEAALVRFILLNPSGVIRADLAAGVDAVALIAQAALAFPEARVVLIVPDLARRWQKDLRRFVTGVKVSTYRDPYAGDSRIVVATPGALGTVNVGRADIVFVTAPLTRVWDDPLLEDVPADPPPRKETFKVNLMARLAGVRGRLFAVEPRNYPTSRYEAARSAQLFGVAEYVATGPGRTERPVRVVWERLSGGPIPAAGDTPLRVKKVSIWSNPVLNRRAGALARALATGDLVALRTRFAGVARGLRRAGPQRTLILVEGLDHAEALSASLKDWPVVSVNVPPPANTPTCVIATAGGAARLCGSAFDVLVRLDLGPDLPPVPLPSWLNTDDTTPEPLLVIDYDARSHPLLRRWGNSRRAAYGSAGWHDPDEDPDVSALARFVAQTSPRRAGR